MVLRQFSQQKQTAAQAYVEEKFLAMKEAEENVLSCILCSPLSIQKVAETLKPEHFFCNTTALIYRAMVSLYVQDRKCTAFNVKDELERTGKWEEIERQESGAYLGLLSTREIAFEGITDPARVIIRKAKMRSLKYVAQQIAQLAEQEDDDAVDQAMKLINEVALDDDAEHVTSFADALDEYMLNLEIARNNFIKDITPGLSTGFADLDRLYKFMPGHLVALGALTGHGKSALATNIALNIALGEAKHVMFTSLEMTKLEIVQRVLSVYSEKDQNLLQRGELDDNEHATLKIHAQRLRKCMIDIDDHSTSLDAIIANVKRVHARNKLDLWVVDYLQLVELVERNKNSNRAQEVAEISKQLKRLAMRLNIPVLALVQLNREVEHQQEPEPKLMHINESGGIARDANAVVFIFSKASEQEKREASMTHQVVIKVAKNRSGRIGNAVLLFAPRLTKFRDADVNNMPIPGEEEDEA